MRKAIAIGMLIGLCGALGCAGSGAYAPSPEHAEADAATQQVESSAAAESNLAALVDIPNAKRPRPYLLTGGMPSEANLASAGQAGFATVVSLLPETEPEQSTVEGLGMTFVSIPVAAPDDLTEDNARKLGAVLQAPDNRPILLHCGSGNRAGALLALEAHFVEGLSPEEALTLGKAAGLTSLEPVVRERLGL